jgi:hypothetical protein
VPDWTDPRWLAEAHAWIRERADVTGPIEQPHVVPWSTVLRAPTPAGPVWFKANDASLAHEARVTALLAATRPDAVPTLLATDPARGWMLLADGGERLREAVERDRDLGRWLDVLPLYAGLQIDLALHAEELLRLGAPDRRLHVLPAQAAEIGALRGELPLIEDLCARLAAYGIPDTIQHDDLHDGQVFLRDGRALVFDWGDAVVSHPFLSMSVPLEGVIAWGLDDVQGSEELDPYRAAYLEPFARYAPRAELEQALDCALRLGWVSRVLASEAGLETPAKREARLRMFRREPVE